MYCGQENEDSSIVCAKCGNTLLDIPTDQMPPLEETHDEEPAPVQGTGPVIQDGQNASSGVVSSPDGQPLPDAAASGTVYPGTIPAGGEQYDPAAGYPQNGMGYPGAGYPQGGAGYPGAGYPGAGYPPNGTGYPGGGYPQNGMGYPGAGYPIPFCG